MKFLEHIMLLTTLILFCKCNLIAQPYIYKDGELVDTSALNHNFWCNKINRYNLGSGQDEVFLNNICSDYLLTWDPTQTWLIVDKYLGLNNIYNCSDTANTFELPEDIAGNGETFLYSQEKNQLYIIGYHYDEGAIDPSWTLLKTIDASTHQIIHSIPIFLGEHDSEYEKMFFSSDGEKIYLLGVDSLTQKKQVLTYISLINQIISRRELSQYGYPNADGYLLHKGRKGISIVHSFFWNETKDSYFRIYNFDNDSGSNFIKYQGYADPYFLDDGKYLILARTEYIEPSVFCTGVFDVYNVSSGKLIKSIYLPSKGRIYTFDNYPNRLYYYLEDENRTIIIDISTIVPKYNLNLNITGNGLITKTPDQTEYDSTSTVVLKAVPSSGNRFNGWSGDTTGTADSIVIEMNSNKNITATFVPKGLIAALKSSRGNLLTGGSLQYYSGGWKDAVNNNNGTFTIATQLKTISLRMTYEYGTQTKSNVTVGTDTIFFQTVNAQVQLKNSRGALIDSGSVQYYSGAWRTLGTTSNGVAVKELLPNNYSFRMTYAFASKDKQQDLNVNPVVVFQTVAANVQLQNSSGNLIDGGTVQYYSGAWRTFGTTTNGAAVKELLPNNYSFRMTYAYASKDKQQDLSVNPVVVFRTVAANVQLQNSSGNLMPAPMGDENTVQYYSGAWRTFGTTTNGVAVKELLPNSYSFRMTYAFASKDKQQNISTNPTVIFQTVATNVQLQNSSGNLIDEGIVQYYSGAWRTFGTTTNGAAVKELLPNSYSFRMTYEYVSNDKTQDLSANSTVNFNTVLCTIKVKDAQGNPVNDAVASYYSGAWRQIGNTVSGEITKELLPANFTFRIKSGAVQLDKTQNLSTNNIVEFSLP